MPVDYSIPSWLKPHDPVSAYTRGVELGQGQQRIDQAARQHQDQLALQQNAQASAAQQHAQQNELSAARIGSQMAAQQERAQLQRAAQQQKAAEAAIRFQGMSEFSKRVSEGVPQEKAFMELAPKMFHKDANGMMNALGNQAKIKEAAAHHATIAAQRAAELERKVQLDASQAKTVAERVDIAQRNATSTEEKYRLQAAANAAKAQAAESKQTAIDVGRMMGVLNIDNATALWGAQQKRAGKPVDDSVLKDRADALRAKTDLEILNRAGTKKAVETVDKDSHRLTISPAPWYGGGTDTTSLLEKYNNKLGQFAAPAAPSAPKIGEEPAAPKGFPPLPKAPDDGKTWMLNPKGALGQVPDKHVNILENNGWKVHPESLDAANQSDNETTPKDETTGEYEF